MPSLRSSVVEHCLDTAGVTGSNPVAPTITWHNFHVHPECPLGGIFYIEDGGSDIGNQWINPIHGYSHRISNLWCKPTYECEFTPGRLVLFPGWILHSARPHQGNKERILFAFNSTPVLHKEQVIRLSNLD